MLNRVAAIVVGAGALAAAASAQPVKRVYQGDFPIAAAVEVPAGSTLVYVSGQVPPVADPKAPPGSLAAFGNTETQTIGVIRRIDEVLKAQGLGLGDVVMMRVFLVGDPALGGKMDFAGMMKGYSQFFGTPAQPNKPARSTVQVAGLVASGFLVEIEVTAVRAR